MRRGLRFGLLGIGVAALTFVGADYLQIGRHAPELAPVTERADLIRVDKSARRLTLFRGSQAITSYNVALGPAPLGHKQREGDGHTPEGRYQIDSKNARSRFHLALHVSYPGAADREAAQRHGVPPGGDIMIHGLPNGIGWLGRLHLNRDWTDGCVAVTNPEMDEIWALVATGTPIEILP